VAMILVVEDEAALRSSLRQSLEMDGYQCAEAGCIRDAWELTRSADYEAIITDLNLVGESALVLVERLRAEGYDGLIVVVTAFGTIETAISAMKRGADEFIQKPVSLEELGLVVSRGLKARKTQPRLALLERLQNIQTREADIVGRCEAWQRTVAMARRFGSIPVPASGSEGELPTILLLGETGSGKGALAELIHASTRVVAGKEAPPFVHVNCAALPASLIEGELFGHEKGAFTDAKASRAGLLELAEGGTIFLDEIAEMPLDMQAKMLLAVERGVFRRLGATRERRVRARIIAATNQNLEQRAASGAFRSDLLFRLNALTIHVPPLRERTDDIALIAVGVMERLRRQLGRPGVRVSAEAVAAMMRRRWPGNVRELINVLRRAAILADGDIIGPELLGADESRASDGSRQPETAGVVEFDFARAGMTLEEVERRLANADALPLDPEAYAPDLRRHLTALDELSRIRGLSLDLAPLRAAIDILEAAAHSFNDRLKLTLDHPDSFSPERRAAIAATLRSLESAWRDDHGLPGRPWYRSLYMAPDETSGYAAWPLPALRGAVEEGDREGATKAAEALRTRIAALSEALSL